MLKTKVKGRRMWRSKNWKDNEEEAEEEEERHGGERGKRRGETGASKARRQRRNTLLEDVPPFKVHPGTCPQNSCLEQAVPPSLSSFFRWGNCSEES